MNGEHQRVVVVDVVIGKVHEGRRPPKKGASFSIAFFVGLVDLSPWPRDGDRKVGPTRRRSDGSIPRVVVAKGGVAVEGNSGDVNGLRNARGFARFAFVFIGAHAGSVDAGSSVQARDFFAGMNGDFGLARNRKNTPNQSETVDN